MPALGKAQGLSQPQLHSALRLQRHKSALDIPVLRKRVHRYLASKCVCLGLTETGIRGGRRFFLLLWGMASWAKTFFRGHTAGSTRL